MPSHDPDGLPELTAAYPPAALENDQLWTAVAKAVSEYDDELTTWLDSAPQTNEVARSAIILGGALLASRLTGLPLELLEIGASAGLNLNFDRYHYDLGGGRTWGNPASPLTITSEWRGALPPLDAPLEILSRAGCDRNPLDAASPQDADRLIAYVWADQTERLARLRTALTLTAASGIKVEASDAEVWTAKQIAATARPVAARYLFHTVVWQYLPKHTQDRITASLEAAGAAATPETPLVHFAVEGDGRTPHANLQLTIWPNKRIIDLGRANFHGRWVEWTLTV